MAVRAVEFRLRDARAGVGDGESCHESVAIALRTFDVQRHASRLGEFERVADEVHQNLPHARVIAQRGDAHIGIELARQRQPVLLGTEREHADHVVGERLQIALVEVQFQLARFNLGQIQHVVDELHEDSSAEDAGLDVLALLVGQLRPQQEFVHPQHAVERRSQITARRAAAWSSPFQNENQSTSRISSKSVTHISRRPGAAMSNNRPSRLSTLRQS